MLEKIIFVVLVTGLILLLAYLDKKFELGLCDDIKAKPETDKQLKQQNLELKERVEVLERIVTEPKFQLNQELAKLK